MGCFLVILPAMDNDFKEKVHAECLWGRKRGSVLLELRALMC